MLTALVYEKQEKLRIMMKMHGLGDGPYWMISYMYFLVISALYMFVFVAFGSLVGRHYFQSSMLSNFCLCFKLLTWLNCRFEILHAERLLHPIFVLFSLYKPANFLGVPGLRILFECQDCYRSVVSNCLI